MENHYFDEHGIYASSAPANPGTLPPDRALRIPPPARDGFWPVVNDAKDGWTLVEDNRGRTGWLDGVRTEVTDLGPLPAGWSDEPPAEPEETDMPVYITGTDTYHREGCGVTGVAGKWMMLSEVRETRQRAKPCRRCRPMAM